MARAPWLAVGTMIGGPWLGDHDKGHGCWQWMWAMDVDCVRGGGMDGAWVGVHGLGLGRGHLVMLSKVHILYMR